MRPRFEFMANGFENTPHPCICMDDSLGGDPKILALISVIYRPTDLHGLCEMANACLDSFDPPPNPSPTPTAEEVARKLHEVLAGSDPDELIHHPAAKSWEDPTEPRWTQWNEAAEAVLRLFQPEGRERS